jgi:hypothetical protein
MEIIAVIKSGLAGLGNPVENHCHLPAINLKQVVSAV